MTEMKIRSGSTVIDTEFKFKEGRVIKYEIMIKKRRPDDTNRCELHFYILKTKVREEKERKEGKLKEMDRL